MGDGWVEGPASPDCISAATGMCASCEPHELIGNSLRRTIEVSFPSHDLANISAATLSVDEELSPDKCMKEFHVEKNLLKV